MLKTVVFLCWFVSLLGSTSACEDNSDVIKTLSQRVSDEQVKQTRRFTDIGHMEEIEGLYRTFIHLDLYGPEEYAIIRRDIGVMDNPPFISGFVGQQILDAYRFGNAPMPPRDDINRIVKLYSENNDKNLDYENSILHFYIQSYNPEHDLWEAFSNNTAILSQPSGLSQMIASLFTGEGKQPSPVVDALNGVKLITSSVLPPDFDSTSAHLSFGSILYQLRDTYPDAWASWKDSNTNLTSVFDALKKFVYRPFSNNSAENSIDTRSYFVTRKFLDLSKEEGRDLALISVWVMNIDTERSGEAGLPSGVNALDMAVTSNVLASVFSAVDTGLIEPEIVTQDDDLNLIIDSSASLLTYNLQNNFTGRPDLAYGLYPLTETLYWFSAKLLLYMENAELKGTLHKIPVFEKMYTGLSDVMRKTITRKILSNRKSEQDGTVFYYDGVLGGADLSYDGKPINRAEDRYYTTAMAANSLVYTWSVYDEGLGALRWIDSVPDEVKATVYGLSHWIAKNPFGGMYGVTNNFFGGAVFNKETLPFWYPANLYQYVNGSEINDFNSPVKIENGIIFGMEGYVDPDTYKKMLDVDQFGMETMMDYHGPDTGHGTGAFWSTDAISYAGAMMALSMTDVLQKSENFLCEE